MKEWRVSNLCTVENRNIYLNEYFTPDFQVQLFHTEIFGDRQLLQQLPNLQKNECYSSSLRDVNKIVGTS